MKTFRGGSSVNTLFGWQSFMCVQVSVMERGLFLVHKETPPWISLSIFKRHRLCILFCLGLIVRNTNTAHCRFCPIVRALDWLLNALFGASLDRRYFDLNATRAEFLESLRTFFSCTIKALHYIWCLFW